MLSRGLECFLERWSAFDRVGIPLYRVGIPLYRVAMLSTSLEYLCTELECVRQCWHAFDRVGIPWYRVGTHSRGLEIFRQSWNTFVQGWNASDNVGMPSKELEYLCTGF
jgi:hypothetical protein